MLAYETEVLATEAEAKAFSVETEANTKTFGLEAEARQRRLKFQPRRSRLSRGTTAPRDGLETEASGPRPHPLNTATICLHIRPSLYQVL